MSSWICGDENGQASGSLANNLPADNADNRFHGDPYRASYGAGQEASRMQAKVVILRRLRPWICHDLAIWDRNMGKRFAMQPVLYRTVFPAKQGETPFSGTKPKTKRFQFRENIKESMQ
ncbi:hypothetical protein PYH37_003352 [Sinorhizobium numidicum]|uniref:Uncharacterized protein n=1 Tax=Sinorhizobium numidicum TaxID=680248 RepID=A0ABY8CWL6_9HYPH|nr:hypothetical protein [Sinorhizobium numidicum]WEX78461.1 hypothetical protein PYH37_003352 [Sinorhizobium numidicum]WEX81857.1 hypothetical protein PYH38_004065 [Sinorhizobium numidicum]